MGYCGKSAMIRICTKTCGKCEGSGICKDEKKSCPLWVKKGYCKQKHVNYMEKNCAKSCGTCGTAFQGTAELHAEGLGKVIPLCEAALLAFCRYRTNS